MILKVGTVCVANDKYGMLIGCITAISPYSSDGLGSYKIEWNDGWSGWSNKEVTLGYVQEAQQLIER